MNKTVLSCIAAVTFGAAQAQQLPQPSPPGKVEQIVGLTTVKVEYSRPSVRDRVIFGDLVPFDAVWRTGANKCTTVEIDGPVQVEGQELAAGTYSLFTIPGRETWVVIFNKNTELWGEGDRKEEEDVLTVKVTPVRAPHTETFTIGFDGVKGDQAVMELRWEAVSVPVTIHADASEKALANIKEALAKSDADFRAYHGSARFCLDRNIMLPEALTWATKSTELEKRFWNLHTLALVQAANGRHKEAIATAQESLKLAEEAKNDAYAKMNRTKIEEWKAAAPAAPSRKR